MRFIPYAEARQQPNIVVDGAPLLGAVGLLLRVHHETEATGRSELLQPRGALGVRREGRVARIHAVKPHLGDAVRGRGVLFQHDVHPIMQHPRDLLAQFDVFLERPLAELVQAHAFLALHQ